ncbi:hypothetical protein SAY86_007061 [Trapa natans]|uniref:Glycosyl hydrolase family 32 C-terminal domain-containing protein n=1 Tax=Trapa natans TaxID=22666 RepID=A0AAN7QXI2_TRANT|nr:hypothetical protein SAY86_007061 [Trapa natans]
MTDPETKSNGKCLDEIHLVMDLIYDEQADVEVVFSFSDVSMAENFDPGWGAAHRICAQKGANGPVGLGPFGLVTLATVDFHEYTHVFFMIFKADNNKHKIVLCSDARNSSHAGDLYKPTFAGFTPLRSLIDNSVVESFGARGRTCITSRVYPEKTIYNNARLFAFNHGSSSITVREADCVEHEER